MQKDMFARIRSRLFALIRSKYFALIIRCQLFAPIIRCELLAIPRGQALALIRSKLFDHLFALIIR
jgi:hypothetical protein